MTMPYQSHLHGQVEGNHRQFLIWSPNLHPVLGIWSLSFRASLDNLLEWGLNLPCAGLILCDEHQEVRGGLSLGQTLRKATLD